MRNKEFDVICPRLYDKRYGFIPIPTIIINGNDLGILDRGVSIQIGWLFWGIRFKFEYTNNIKARRMAKEWEAEARLKELRNETTT